jgi:putative PEP-CTERM system histidine kinase
MNLPFLLAFAACGAAMVVGTKNVFRGSMRLADWCFAVGMTLFAVETFLGMKGAEAANPEEIVYWHELRLAVGGFIPGVWLLFSLSYARGNYREFLYRWRFPLAGAFLIPGAIVLGFRELLIRGLAPLPSGDFRLVLSHYGWALNICYLLSLVAVLMNLEKTFRASVGTMRWRIKFMVLGMGLLFSVQLYTSSQVLLYSGILSNLASINAWGLLLGSGLAACAIFREQDRPVQLYPSQAVLYNSLVLLLVGIYLLVIGVLAKLLDIFWDDELLFKAFLVLFSLTGLTVLLLSERIQQRGRRFISRHFKRPLYDCGKVWRTVTGKTGRLLNETAYCRAVAELVSDTFKVLSVTVWLLEENKTELRFGVSTSLAGEGARGEDLANRSSITEMARFLEEQPFPVDMGESKQAWARHLEGLNPDVFTTGGNRVCLPLVGGQELVGLMVLGDRVNGAPFSVEEFDLLKCIGDQTGTTLLNIRLSKKVLEAKELEAFQAMSAFFVHDLKNTASTLSLMLQNLPVHFDNPEFREDALRGIGRSVQHINDLIGRLKMLREKLEIKPVETDLNEVVRAALSGMGKVPPGFIQELPPLPKSLMDGEQVQKVVTNLVLNAREAAGECGEVRIRTERQNGWMVLSVEDNGCGMSPEFLGKSLFRPFQTTKKNGIGIGMFHSKIIVEAHRGRIEVESTEGKGTLFRVLLPYQSKADHEAAN